MWFVFVPSNVTANDGVDIEDVEYEELTETEVNEPFYV